MSMVNPDKRNTMSERTVGRRKKRNPFPIFALLNCESTSGPILVRTILIVYR